MIVKVVCILLSYCIVSSTRHSAIIMSIRQLDCLFVYCRGFDRLYETCMDFLLHGLACQPISQQLCRSNRPQCSTLLLYGSGSTAGGGGKTSLAHALCNTLGKHPVLAHVSVVECVSLRGGYFVFTMFAC